MKRAPLFNGSMWRRALGPWAFRWRNLVLPSAPSPDRLLLWADAVGGFLVCLKSEIVLGQPVANAAAGEALPDVPILGDISRRQAIIRRDGESYTVEAVRPVSLDGRELSPGATAALRDGSELEMGHGVRLKFRRPHPLSATARLEFLSRHRTQPTSDAVLLLAETAIIGPAANSHIVAPAWQREVLLFRQGLNLACRTSGKLLVDGFPQTGRTTLQPNSRVEGDDFSFSLEPL